MVKRNLLSFIIIISMVLTMVIGTGTYSFAADITNEFTVTKIEVTHDNGDPVTQTDPLQEGTNLGVAIEGKFDKKDVYVGDTMLIPIVANAPIKLSTTSTTAWFDLSYGAQGVIGRFRLNTNAQVEVEITKDTNNVTELTFNLGNSIRCTNIPQQNGVQTGTIGALGTNQTVYFSRSSNISPANGSIFTKFTGNKGNDFIDWVMNVNTESLSQLYKKEDIDRYENVYVEDEFSGNSNVSLEEIKALFYSPLNLTDPEPWQMGNRSSNLTISPSQYTKVDQNPGESYEDLKNRLGDFEYAIYEDTVNNKKKFVIHLGDLTENSKFKVENINSDWASGMATTWINQGFFTEAERTDLIN